MNSHANNARIRSSLKFLLIRYIVFELHLYNCRTQLLQKHLTSACPKKLNVLKERLLFHNYFLLETWIFCGLQKIRASKNINLAIISDKIKINLRVWISKILFGYFSDQSRMKNPICSRYVTQGRETNRLTYNVSSLSLPIFRHSGVKNWNAENTNGNL